MVRMLVLKNYLNGLEVVISNQKEGVNMEFLGFLAAPAFVFALAAIAQTNKFKDRINKLEEEIEELKIKTNKI
ncbi:MAG: hypothetical protein K9K76_03355 [Halanaerobiales bacterium]|nr:hypothetical protein [Halanaerobiales bacterium]